MLFASYKYKPSRGFNEGKAEEAHSEPKPWPVSVRLQSGVRPTRRVCVHGMSNRRNSFAWERAEAKGSRRFFSAFYLWSKQGSISGIAKMSSAKVCV